MTKLIDYLADPYIMFMVFMLIIFLIVLLIGILGKIVKSAVDSVSSLAPDDSDYYQGGEGLPYIGYYQKVHEEERKRIEAKTSRFDDESIHFTEELED